MKSHFFTLGLVTTILTSSCPAAVIIGNIGTTGTGNVQVPTANDYIGWGFSMGGTGAGLENIRVQLDRVDSNGSDPSFNLYTDSAGEPGAVALSFTLPALDLNNEQTYTLTPAAPFTLQANTNYWLVLEGGGSTATWFRGAEPTGPGATHVGRRLSADGGGTWGALGTGTTSRLGVEVNVVPEPSSFLLASAGVMLLGFRRKR